MTLQELEDKWRTYLKGEDCPPVLGLAPLSENESELIRRVVASVLLRYSSVQKKAFLALIEKFPACVAVWLARKAGEAYEAGAFWERFGGLIGLPIPVNQRHEFAFAFQRACRRTMSTWFPCEEGAGHNIVAEFLHQAGLPLDRCAGFAQHIRKVERELGLPDAEASDCGEELRDALLESLQSISVPTLKRALRGPAGPRICEVALAVVLKGDYSGINPRLGLELANVFDNGGGGSLRRSMHQPFLRLGKDLGSLEVVGPVQDSSVVAGDRLTWILDGRRVPTPRGEEFVAEVTARSRVVLELHGLAQGATPPRTVVIRLDDLTDPFLLFDDRNRKQRRTSGLLPPGSYWLLHRTTDALLEAEQRYDWPDGERTLSFFRISPGMKVTLD
ncbi:MAG: hypothetical protein ACRD7E_25165, partial [Bryobacteraceae bacterium]